MFSVLDFALCLAMCLYIVICCREKTFVFFAGLIMMILRLIAGVVIVFQSAMLAVPSLFGSIDSERFADIFLAANSVSFALSRVINIMFIVVIFYIVSKDKKDSEAQRKR